MTDFDKLIEFLIQIEIASEVRYFEKNELLRVDVTSKNGDKLNIAFFFNKDKKFNYLSTFLTGEVELQCDIERKENYYENCN